VADAIDTDSTNILGDAGQIRTNAACIDLKVHGADGSNGDCHN